MTIIWMLAYSGFSLNTGLNKFETGKLNCTYPENVDEKNYVLCLMGYAVLFSFLLYMQLPFLQVLLGITKFLQNGTCSITSQNRLFNWLSVLANLSDMTSLVTKGLFAGLLMAMCDNADVDAATMNGAKGVAFISTLITLNVAS